MTEALPTGTVTFLFTDIEGSTSLARTLGARWPEVLEEHHRLLGSAIREHHGVLVKTDGDSVFAVFASAVDGVAASAAAQRSLTQKSWPDDVAVRVRMGLHTGEGTLGGADYVGLDVHRAARIAAAGHGGQVLLSDSTGALVEQNLPDGVALKDLGRHGLKDFDEPRTIYQLTIDGLPADFPPLKTLEIATNLPVSLTSFVGREHEVRQLTELLDSARLVTLTGPGGTGKTRLSLAAASEVKGRFPDGAYFVELAPIADPDLVPGVIGSTLGIAKEGSDPPLEMLKGELRSRKTLLLLDNFEQIIQASPVVGDLLASCPDLKVIVTSREPLRITGEHEFPVPALGLPDENVGGGIDRLRRVDSVALFLQRAAAVRPGFDLSPDNAAPIAGICARLDGLPLALELAAARIKLFEPAELLARLGSSLSLAGGRDLTERQRTLRGAIDWSYDLLSEPEQVTFRRLSVFAGGCSFEAAEAVCLPGELDLDLVDVITSLHDKSLLRRDLTSTGALRLMMLQTIRDYAAERLGSSGEAQDAGKRHARFFMELAERAEEHLLGPEQQQWLQTLDPELDNFRAAIRWAIERAETDVGLRLAASLERFWMMRNHLREGRALLEELLGLSGGGRASRERAKGLAAAANLANWQGDYEASRQPSAEALASYRALGDWEGVADQLNNMGYAATTADPAAALELFTESIEAYRRAGSPPQIGQSLIGLALPEMQVGKTKEASVHLEEALDVFQRCGDETLSLVAGGLLGICSRLEGNLAEARERYADVLERSQRAGSDLALTLPLWAFADLALVEGDHERAAILYAAQEQLAERLGGVPSMDLAGLPDVAEGARAELGDERFEQAAALGRAKPLQEIIELALASSAS